LLAVFIIKIFAGKNQGGTDLNFTTFCGYYHMGWCKMRVACVLATIF
jgi:hypothetical protein